MSTKFVTQVRFRTDKNKTLSDWHDECGGHATFDDAIICCDTAQRNTMALKGRLGPFHDIILALTGGNARIAVVDTRIIKRISTEEILEERLDVLTPVKPKKDIA